MSNRIETRAAISALLDAGDAPKAIADKLGVARSTVFCVKKKQRGAEPTKVTFATRKNFF